MRIYYVFDIRSEYVDLYKETPNSLYNVLHQLYYMRKKDLEYGFNMFKQLANRIDKDEVDKNIFLKLHNKMTYVKKKDNHIINNLYKDEVSILTIKNAYIYVTTNNNYTSFFNVIDSLGDEYFACDFEKLDYFWLNDIKMLV